MECRARDGNDDRHLPPTRSADRDQECQDTPKSDVEGADCEVRVQRRRNRRDQRISQTEKAQQQIQPEQKSQKLEQAAGPPLKHRAMQTNDPRRTKWPDLQCNDNQSFDDPNGGVEHSPDVNAPEKIRLRKKSEGE